ncbi:MBL fold metallo-hydrolase [Dankookia sp. GCM10030260]|uniref:MBL fold metallo-hydrolase n=1 Tax=Dankookia sp. GCM10030260 TaxID=3273390 RepID=UPI00360DEE96
MLHGQWRHLDRNLVAFSTTPPLGLNGTGWLLLHPEGNIAFEAAPFYTDDMLAEIDRLGGIRFLAASHVHGYGALWQLQDVFRPEVLAIQKEDLWLTKAFRVTWPYDEALELRPGLTLYHVGGHYEGQAVLHDAARRILFCGDTFKVDQDADGSSTAVSTHKAFHKSIPLTPAEIRRYREVIAPLDFDTVCTPFEHAPGIGREIALAVLDDQLCGPPGVRHIPLDELRRRIAG